MRPPDVKVENELLYSTRDVGEEFPLLRWLTVNAEWIPLQDL